MSRFFSVEVNRKGKKYLWIKGNKCIGIDTYVLIINDLVPNAMQLILDRGVYTYRY